MKTVKEQVSRPSVLHRIATDWVIGGCLKRCLMYSRGLYNIIEAPVLRKTPAPNYIITRLSKDILSIYGFIIKLEST